MTPEQAQGTEILALAIDDAEHLELMVQRVRDDGGQELDFPLLSDPDHAVIARYGLLNQEDPQDRPIPHPTVFLIDREGVVRWKFIEINYRIRPTNDDVLAALGELRSGASQP